QGFQELFHRSSVLGCSSLARGGSGRAHVVGVRPSFTHMDSGASGERDVEQRYRSPSPMSTTASGGGGPSGGAAARARQVEPFLRGGHTGKCAPLLQGPW